MAVGFKVLPASCKPENILSIDHHEGTYFSRRLRHAASAADAYGPEANRRLCEQAYDHSSDWGESLKLRMLSLRTRVASDDILMSWYASSAVPSRPYAIPQALKNAGVTEVILAINYQPQVSLSVDGRTRDPRPTASSSIFCHLACAYILWICEFAKTSMELDITQAALQPHIAIPVFTRSWWTF